MSISSSITFPECPKRLQLLRHEYFFDDMFNLRQEFDKLKIVGPTATGVSCGYGMQSIPVDKKIGRTLIQTANAIMRLPMAGTKAIGNICKS